MADQNAISAATEHLSGQEGSDQGSHGALAGALLVKPKAIKTTICPISGGSAGGLEQTWSPNDELLCIEGAARGFLSLSGGGDSKALPLERH